jgi:hypothetical protein
MRFFRVALLIVLAFWLVFLLYVRWNKSSVPPDGSGLNSVSAQTIAVVTIGENRDRGNLLGIQPFMTTFDYVGPDRFRDRLEFYLDSAQRKGLIVPQKTVVIFPEYVGTWLVAMGEDSAVYAAPTVQKALTSMVLSHPLDFWRAYRAAPDSTKDKTRYAVFRMKANKMAAAYYRAFDYLAAKYAVTIVAGSILLPNPSVQNHRLVAGDGSLYNVSMLFRPDGFLEPQLVRKLYPITDELPFVCPSNPDELPVFDTPVGRLGVLVCADSWNSPPYGTLRKKGATLLAIPSYSSGNGAWAKSWGGYSGTPTPAAAKADVGKLTEGQAWLKYAMGGRAKSEAGITKGMNVFLRGNLWDLGSDGTTVVLNDSVHVAKSVNGPSLTCLWL